MYRVREPDAEVSISAGSVGGMLTSWSAAYTEGMQETTIIRARHREKIFFMVFIGLYVPFKIDFLELMFEHIGNRKARDDPWPCRRFSYSLTSYLYLRLLKISSAAQRAQAMPKDTPVMIRDREPVWGSVKIRAFTTVMLISRLALS